MNLKTIIEESQVHSESNIILIWKPDKDITRKENRKKKRHKKKKSRSISLRNVNVKILHKILENQIQQYIKCYFQVIFIPGIQDWVNIW